jgi:hypothetical protein
MRQLRRRISAIKAALGRGVADSVGHEAALELEFCFLQIRLSIELIALAVLAAHNEIEGFRRKDLMKAWHAESLIKQLAKLSDDAFPRAITVSDTNSEGIADMFVHHHAADRERLLQIYAQCGDRLHSGNLRSLLRDGGKFYQVSDVTEATNFIINLMDQHVILLPDGKRMVVSLLRYAPTQDVHCFLTGIRRGGLVDPRVFPLFR